MNLQKITINLGILLILDILLGTLYRHLQQMVEKPDVNENSERAFRCKEKYFHHGLTPDFDGQAFWHRPYRMSTDNLGFKSNPGRTISFCQDNRRTVFLGDSFTEGIGVEYQQTFAGLFGKANPYMEVVNMGLLHIRPSCTKKNCVILLVWVFSMIS